MEFHGVDDEVCSVRGANSVVDGSMCRENISLNILAACVAMSQRADVGMPRGRSFDLSLGSLCKQKR